MTKQRGSMDIHSQPNVDWAAQRCGCWPKGFRENVTCCQWLWSIIFFISFMLLIVMLPLSFSYVEYDEYALRRHTIENTVELDKTYSVGRYFWGVDREPLAFSRQFRKLTETFSIFPTNGLEFDVDVVFWYRLQKENIGKLYKAFGNAFESQVRNRANAKIKNVAPNFALDDYIVNRPIITTTLHSGLVGDLNEIFMDLPLDKFYLANVEIPAEVKQKDLDTAVQAQRNIEEQNHQIAVLVRKETDRLVEVVAAEIDLIGLTATAQAEALQKEAEAVAEKTESSADGLGLQNVFLQVNVTDTPTKEKYIAYFAFLDSVSVTST